MARKTKAEAEKTRKAILKAALAVFTQKGFARTTLHDIAKRAGCTRGAVYWHFKDKVDLFKELHCEMEAAAGLNSDALLHIRAQSLGEIKGAFLHYINVFIDNEEYREFYKLTMYKTEWSEELQPVLDQEKFKFGKELDSLTKDFEFLKGKGKVRPDLDCRRAAASLCAYVEGLVGMWLFMPRALPLNEWAEPLLGEFLGGFAP